MAARHSRFFLAAIAVMVTTVMGVAGCRQWLMDSGTWDLEGHRGLLLDIRHYYEDQALEENGTCPSPLMGGITGSQLLSENETQIELELGYFYRDALDEGDDCDPELRPLRCTVMVSCRGTSQRRFTIAKTPDGFEVLSMTGEQRR